MRFPGIQSPTVMNGKLPTFYLKYYHFFEYANYIPPLSDRSITYNVWIEMDAYVFKFNSSTFGMLPGSAQMFVSNVMFLGYLIKITYAFMSF